MDRVLIADIGGTNARFALVDGELGSARRVTLPTSEYDDGLTCVVDAMSALGASGGVGAACFAVAGPVEDGIVTLTNASVTLSESALAGCVGAPVKLVNDFMAVSRAIPDFSELVQVGGRDPVPRAPRVVLGPGTGLGVGALLPERVGGWRCVASEAAHSGLAPGSPLEHELLGILLARTDYVCWETVVSGTGLPLLHDAVCHLWGIPDQGLTPSEITARGLTAEDPVCHQTLEVFCSLLGGLAGNLALTFCARGGVYIAGGIVPRMHEFVAASALRRRFEEKGGLSGFVQPIPAFLVLDDEPGLMGALAFGREMIRKGAGADGA